MLMPNIGVHLRSSLMRDGLSRLLTKAGFCVFPEPNLADDVAVVIIDFCDCHDPERLRAYEQSEVKVVALAHDDDLRLSDGPIEQLSGILMYRLSGDAFVRALRLICAGERVFPDILAIRQNRPTPPTADEPQGRAVRLSPREREVLVELVEGRSNKAIARTLGMSEATVKVHLKNVLRKIRVDNRTQAAMWAISNLSEFAALRRNPSPSAP